MTNEKSIKWRMSEVVLPSTKPGVEVHDLLMCSVYNGYPDGDVEWYYDIGRFRTGKFYEKDGRECFPQYWALINKPRREECDRHYDDLTDTVGEGGK